MRIGIDAASLGFDWDHPLDALDKVAEEVEELREAIRRNHDNILDELGDLFFALISVTRKLNANPEDIIADANTKFNRRFAFVVSALEASGGIENSTLVEMEKKWSEAKAQGL